MKTVCTLVCLLLVAASGAHAEIEKIAGTTENQICFFSWPKLVPVDGWYQDQQNSFHYNFNALAPDGFTFGNAESVMYAEATYKPRVPDSKSLAAFIEEDIRRFAALDITIREAAALATADGQTLRSLTFFPTTDTGNWERVSYGEESDYYLVFTLSSRSKAGFDAAMAAYEKLIAGYRENPAPDEASREKAAQTYELRRLPAGCQHSSGSDTPPQTP